MDRQTFTVAQFCAAHNIGRTLFYELVNQGQGPRLMKVGRRTLVSMEAAADWRKSIEKLTSAEAEAVTGPVAAQRCHCSQGLRLGEQLAPLGEAPPIGRARPDEHERARGRDMRGQVDHRHLTAERVTEQRHRTPGIPFPGRNDSGSDNVIGHCGIPKVVLSAGQRTAHALSGEVGHESRDSLCGEGRGERPVIAGGHAERGEKDDHRVTSAAAIDPDDRRVSPVGQLQVAHVFHPSTVCVVARLTVTGLSWGNHLDPVTNRRHTQPGPSLMRPPSWKITEDDRGTT